MGENEGILCLIFLNMVSYVSLSNKDSGINGEDKTICHNEASTPHIKTEYWKLAKKVKITTKKQKKGKWK